MGGVFCPTCESVVAPSAAYCLGCGHDLSVQGPITSTGHDLNQLKDVVRMRDDLSMAEKFDIIAKVEEGANPIVLGIAAPADLEDVPAQEEETATSAPSLQAPSEGWGHSTAARAASEEVARSSRAMGLVEDGSIDRSSDLFHAAMDRGLAAAARIHAVASGAEAGSNPEAMSEVSVLEPPKRSFCPKCGSDIHSMAVHQWGKWRGLADGVLLQQLEAAMEAALVEMAGHYATSSSSSVDEAALRKEIEAKVRAELEAGPSSDASSSDASSSDAVEAEAAPADSKPEKKEQPAKKEPAKPKKKSSPFGGGKRPKMTYEGPPEGKAEWFLEEALETVYDPHGTGKALKPKTILARSSDGNVRVLDVVHAYAADGKDGISELAWTSPLTKYIIEAYDAC